MVCAVVFGDFSTKQMAILSAVATMSFGLGMIQLGWNQYLKELDKRL
jgi:hypothetical protein